MKRFHTGMKELCCAAMYVMVIATGLVHAQPPPVRLTLPDAISRGLAASERLAELAARQEAARAVEDQRTAAERPQLAALAGYLRTNHIEEFSVPNQLGGTRVIYPDIPNIFRTRIDLQWPIYTGGRLQALTRAARSEVDAAGLDREAARADLTLEITRAFWAVVTARASQAVVAQALQRTGVHLVDVRNQLTVGLVPPSDVLTIEAQQAHQQLLSIEAAGLVEAASADFRRLTGLDPDTPFDLDSGPVVPEDFVEPFRVAADQARAVRPERKALQFRIAAAAEREAAASGGSLPALNAVGGYDVARPNTRIFPIERAWRASWDIGVNVRWPLFEAGRTRAETAEAAAHRRGLEARLRDFDSTVDAEIRQRVADLRSARAAIPAAEAGVRAAAEARRVIAERFGAGVATNTDVLTAHVSLLQAELDLTRAIANTQLAAARLDRAMGR